MDYLLDSDHISFLQRGHPVVQARLRATRGGDRVGTTVVNVGELLLGVYLLPDSRRRRDMLAFYQRTVNEMPFVLPVTSNAANRYAAIAADLRSRGRMIPSNDIWIAAVAIEHSATLVTNDDHYRRIELLRLENWTT